MSVSQHARPGPTGRPVRASGQDQPYEAVALLAAHIARARAGTGGLVVLRGATGTVVAALGISGPSPRLVDRREEFGRLLNDRAEQLSGLLRRKTRKEGVA